MYPVLEKGVGYYRIYRVLYYIRYRYDNYVIYFQHNVRWYLDMY